MSIALRIEDVSKMYRLGTVGTGTLSHDLNRLWAKVLGKADPTLKIGMENKRAEGGGEYVWALKDINLEIEQGEILGIIGRNGAGKSTLLKLLSRVTAPTTGTIKAKGRIASLLEVGTGFHPELTGRENVYLNGAILGMSKQEVAKQMDAIVEFSGCAKFIDTPVKRYSSGMTVRLGFSVAAHLESEILIVDEVLAVGDAEFQNKCIGKMETISESNKTIIFVSHQLNMIESLCDRVCIVDQGSIKTIGNTEETISIYAGCGYGLQTEWSRTGQQSESHADRHFNPTRLAVVDSQEEPFSTAISNSTQIGIVVEGIVSELSPALQIGFAIYASNGQVLFWSLSTDCEQETWPTIRIGRNKLVCWLPKGLLNHGTFHVHLVATLHMVKWIAQPLFNAPQVSFQINGQLSRSPLWQEHRPGLLAPALKFAQLAE